MRENPQGMVLVPFNRGNPLGQRANSRPSGPIDISSDRVVPSSIMESVPYGFLQGLLRRSCLRLWPLALLVAASLTSGASTPVPIQTIYVIPSSHWDLGFLRTPNDEKDAIKPHLDAVISACEADPQFRWTIESGWQLQAWLERTKDPAQIEHLAKLMQGGQIELSAAYGSMHTEFMASEELNRLVSAGSHLAQRFGIHPKVAMLNDVPGFSLRLPQALSRSGIRYLITGSNTALGGGAGLWPGKVPFYWESPDGSKVLTWQTQGANGGYTEGMADYFLDPDAEDPYQHTKLYPKEWAGLPNLEIMQRGVDKLLKQYGDAGYHQSSVAVFYMHDGIGPEYELKGLLPNVRAWNASGRSPRIVVATPSEYFANLEAHGAQDAPTYKGDWSGLWSEVKLNSAAMSADARALQGELPETETLWSVLTMERLAAKYPNEEIGSDYTDLFEYDEHNGAGQGGWPKVLSRAEVLEQNREYSEELRTARSSAAMLLHSGFEKLASASGQHSGKRALLVYNTRSWANSRLVKVPDLLGSWTVRDADTGAEVSAQRLASGELCFEARDLPSLGYRTYWLEPSAAPVANSAALDSSLLESPYFRVKLNPSTGAVVSITDLRTLRVIVNENGGGHVGALMLNGSAYEEPGSATSVVLHRERGKVVDQVVIDRPGSLWPQTIVSLPQDQPVVRLKEVLDRSKMRLVANGKPRDMYSFAFDFSLQGKMQHWVENGEGLYRFPEDLLPGARKDGVVPHHTLVWSDDTDASLYRVMLAEKQAFLNRFRTHNATPTDPRSTDGALVDVMIKSDQGETRDQGITTFETYEPGYPATYDFSFALTGESGTADSVAAHRFDADDESDFVELPSDSLPATRTASFVTLSVPNVVVEVLKPSSDGKPEDFLLRLQEIAGKPTELSLKLPLPIRAIAETTLTEDRIVRSGIQPNAVRLSPYQTVTLRLSVVRRTGAASGEEN